MYQRNPMHAPAIAAASSANSSWFCRNPIAPNARTTIVTLPAASPSRPSVRFTAFEVAVIMTATSSR